MKVLVTGALGYVGSGLTLDSQIVRLDLRPGADLQGCISNVQIPDDVESVIHLADRRLDELDEDNWELNVANHRKFIQSLQNRPHVKRIVFASSCSVYGHQDGELDESSQVMATSYYAKSKLAVECMLKESSLPFVICRFGTAYGASSPMRWDLLPNSLGQALLQESSLEIYDPDSLRPYTHVDDIRRGLVFALKVASLGSTLNFAGENLSKASLVEIISAATKKNAEHIHFDFKRKENRHYCVDSSVAKKMGYVFERSVRQEFSKWKDGSWKELSLKS